MADPAPTSGAEPTPPPAGVRAATENLFGTPAPPAAEVHGPFPDPSLSAAEALREVDAAEARSRTSAVPTRPDAPPDILAGDRLAAVPEGTPPANPRITMAVPKRPDAPPPVVERAKPAPVVEPETSAERAAEKAIGDADARLAEKEKFEEGKRRLSELDRRFAAATTDEERLAVAEDMKKFVDETFGEVDETKAKETKAKKPDSAPKEPDSEAKKADELKILKETEKELLEIIKPLSDENKSPSKKPGEVRFPPEIVQTHIYLWRTREAIAKREGRDTVPMSLHEIEAMLTTIGDQKAAAKDPESVARLKDDHARLRKYWTAVSKAVSENPPTDEEIYLQNEIGLGKEDVTYEVKIIPSKLPTEPKPPVLPPGPPKPPVDPKPPVLPPVPPIDPKPPVVPPVEPPPPGPEPRPRPVVPELSAEQLAKARIESEKLSPLHGKEKQKELREAKAEFAENFEAYVGALAYEQVANLAEIADVNELSVNYMTISQTREAELLEQKALADKDRAPGFKGLTDAEFDASIKIQQDYQAKQVLKQQECYAAHQEQNALFEAIRAQELLKVRKLVDDAMLAERLKKKPNLLVRINQWMNKHPMSKIALGGGLAALSIAGTVTGILPLVGIAGAGFGILRAGALYTGTRGVGEKVGQTEKFGAGKIENKANIGEELDAQEKQTKIRRYSKRIGALIAAGSLALTAFQLNPRGPKVPGSEGRRWNTTNPVNPDGSNPLVEQARAGGLRGPRLQTAINQLRSNVRPDQLPKVDQLIASEGIYGPHVQLLAGLRPGAQARMALPVFDRFMAGI